MSKKDKELGQVSKDNGSVVLIFVHVWASSMSKVDQTASFGTRAGRFMTFLVVSSRQDVAFSCKEGWCKACWHTDPMLLGKLLFAVRKIRSWESAFLCFWWL